MVSFGKRHIGNFWDLLTSKVSVGAAGRKRDENLFAVVAFEASGVDDLGGSGQGGGGGGQSDDGEDELHVGGWLQSWSLLVWFVWLS
jgi:hypothetical protein